MNGIFTSLDGVLFYVFFEASLIPLYPDHWCLGRAKSGYAAFKFFLYTLFGSCCCLLALMYLFIQSGGSFSDSPAWHQVAHRAGARRSWLFLAFADRLCGQGSDVAGYARGCRTLTSKRPDQGLDRLAAIAEGCYGFLRFAAYCSGCIPFVGLRRVVADRCGLYRFRCLFRPTPDEEGCYSRLRTWALLTLGFHVQRHGHRRCAGPDGFPRFCFQAPCSSVSA